LNKFLFILLFFIYISPAFPQDDKNADTIRTNDSLKVKIDTSKQKESDIDAVIDYTAQDSVVFDIKLKKVFLFNNAELIYKELKLNSGKITLDQETQVLYAMGIPDTTGIKGKFVQLPLMFQGSEKYEGTELSYNFKSQQGNISMGYSDADIGYYFGEKIKKVTPEVYFIKNGLYTTSNDKIDPEYYFFSPKMKVIPQDKVIAQSVFLYIEGVPVFWIPFGVFPNNHGRSSGIIIPTYGTDATYGTYFSNFGYFWATNDYMDLTAKGSIFLKGRYDMNARYRYALKYNFTGSIEAGYSSIRLGESKDIDKFSSDQWVLNINHNQKINPTTTIDGNLSFVSGKSYYDNSTNQLPDLLRQNVVSNLTFSKYWEETPYSLYINYYRDQNLLNGNVNERFPSINFTRSESFPFRKDLSATNNLKLYEYLSYSYSGQFINNRVKQTVKGYLGQDSTYRDSHLGVMHALNFNFSPQFDVFNIRPFFSYNEIWYGKYITKTFNLSDSSLSVANHDGFKAVRYFQTGVSFNTKFIGIFKPNIFNITGLRHTITPSITYAYRPDFSSDKWGYYGSYKDASGKNVKYSLFEKEIFGGAPFGESQSVNFSIGNLFEMKTKVNDTLDNKFQLININASTSYNFAADSLKWSELQTDFRTAIGNLLNIGGGATFNFYEFDPTVNTRVNRFLLTTKGKIADLTAFNINLSTSFNLLVTNQPKVENKPMTPEDSLRQLKEPSKKGDEDKVSYNVPITGGFNYNFSESKWNPLQVYKTNSLSANIGLNLSEKWKFTFAASYDFINKQISAPYITAYRDLKSWEINFNWYPLGAYKGFFFQVRIKAPSLNDVKLTRQTNSRGVY
jgi:lipopolysaccharide assembly outer membrane protein LptD (OstA)